MNVRVTEEQKEQISQTAVGVLRRELERKAVDALHRLLLDYENGEVSQEALSYAIDTLFTTVSGLVSNDVFAMISATDVLFREGEREVSVTEILPKEALAHDNEEAGSW